MKKPKIPPLEIIEDRKEFQKNRVPQLAEEFELKKVVVEKNTCNYPGVVAIEPIDFSAKCEHHVVGIHGKAFFAYLPGPYLIGLSQVARIIEAFLNVTQEIIQEEATLEIVNYFEQILKPKGLWLVIKARHECMSARGVRQRNSLTTTSVMRGVFHTDHALRDEVFKLWSLKI